MTLTLARPPAGEWINPDVRTHIAEAGAGISSGRIHDHSGLVGTVDQPLLIAAHR